MDFRQFMIECVRWHCFFMLVEDVKATGELNGRRMLAIFDYQAGLEAAVNGEEVYQWS